jgi:Flp pilus assembly protein TadD
MRWKDKLMQSLAVAAIGFALAAGVEARGSKSKENKEDSASKLYAEGVKLAEAGDFGAALERFENANKERKNDPDILNMLGFTQRKLGRLDAAFASYAKALQLRPDFPEAREYLGEAHLQAALEQLRLLSEQGAAGEVAELRAAIAQAAWRAGVGNARAAGDSGAAAAPDSARRW